jgi:hypothetical protein
LSSSYDHSAEHAALVTEITSDQIVYLVVRVDPCKVLPAGYGSK